jgi:hypothetical protein
MVTKGLHIQPTWRWRKQHVFFWGPSSLKMDYFYEWSTGCQHWIRWSDLLQSGLHVFKTDLKTVIFSCLWQRESIISFIKNNWQTIAWATSPKNSGKYRLIFQYYRYVPRPQLIYKAKLCYLRRYFGNTFKLCETASRLVEYLYREGHLSSYWQENVVHLNLQSQFDFRFTISGFKIERICPKSKAVFVQLQ